VDYLSLTPFYLVVAGIFSLLRIPGLPFVRSGSMVRVSVSLLEVRSHCFSASSQQLRLIDYSRKHWGSFFYFFIMIFFSFNYLLIQILEM
jgi:hypothetical protein